MRLSTVFGSVLVIAAAIHGYPTSDSPEIQTNQALNRQTAQNDFANTTTAPLANVREVVETSRADKLTNYKLKSSNKKSEQIQLHPETTKEIAKVWTKKLLEELKVEELNIIERLEKLEEEAMMAGEFNEAERLKKLAEELKKAEALKKMADNAKEAKRLKKMADDAIDEEERRIELAEEEMQKSSSSFTACFKEVGKEIKKFVTVHGPKILSVALEAAVSTFQKKYNTESNHHVCNRDGQPANSFNAADRNVAHD